jgi:hypothetical protein
VIRERLLDEQEPPGRARQSGATVGAVLDDACVAGRVRVVDVEAAVLRVARVERHRQKPLLASARDQPPDVEKRLRSQPAPLEHANQAGLLDDVEAARLAGRGGNVDGGAQPPDDGHETQRRRPAGCPRAGRERKRGGSHGERAG